ncbi:hypothetical protein [uncultured Desulfobacter sp.]|jgi:prophage DNA circulation protein|uniref:hypothetical protein n=1 Tax=uncultured Desulfobacter sp. TaxID=240139 RepID=UPI0029C96936|nr:hypothetical protein [uncultured Desulfobacter sp.]
MATLRESVVNTINELHPLINKDISEEEKNAVRSRLTVLYAQLEAIISQTIPNTTPGFDDAVTALESATNEAKQAKKDTDKVATTIKKTAEAINKIEKIIKIGVQLVA